MQNEETQVNNVFIVLYKYDIFVTYFLMQNAKTQVNNVFIVLYKYDVFVTYCLNAKSGNFSNYCRMRDLQAFSYAHHY